MAGGRRVAVTGVSRGIGRALAEAALARGDRVIGTVRRAGEAPGGVEEVLLDVADERAQAGFAARLSGEALDILVCNAGLYLGRGRIGAEEEGFGAEDWARTFMTNVAGVFFTVRAALPALRRGVRPRVAVISSGMGSSARAKGGSYIYRASKAAATNLAANLALDLRAEGIAVGAYHPGWVRTDMGTGAADIAAGESAAGLLARMEALTLDRTGVFETWDGTPLPF